MALVLSTLKADLKAALEDSFQSAKDLEGATPSQVESARPPIVEALVTASAEATKAYLESMQDLSGDNPAAIPMAPLESIFSEVFGMSGETEQRVPQAEVQAAWSMLFPVSFQVAAPAPGMASETTSIASAVTPLGPIAGAYQMSSDEDGLEEFTSVIAEAIDTGASAITTTIIGVAPNGSPVTVSGPVS